jgi:hypothetical protein
LKVRHRKSSSPTKINKGKEKTMLQAKKKEMKTTKEKIQNAVDAGSVSRRI